ncbi:hypothetical protein FLI59_34425, partial [Pseudomonas aeruginosa]
LVGEQPEIGISRLVEDSDTFFSDKALFTHCSFIPKGGSDVDDDYVFHRNESANYRNLDEELQPFIKPAVRFNENNKIEIKLLG